MITSFSGTCYKIIFEHEIELVLSQGSTSRPAARFNRLGQDALYLSATEACARTAMRKYVKPNDRPRVLAKYELSQCQLFDLRHADALEYRTSASSDWLAEFNAGDEPKSWSVADYARGLDVAGLIDPSRKSPQCWHLSLFGWNSAGYPSLKLIDKPHIIDLSA